MKPSAAGPKVVALLLLGLWLQISALALCPDLHRYLHQDSAAGHHECLVTLLGKGDLPLLVERQPALPAPRVLSSPVVSLDPRARTLAVYRLAPCRAPPLSPPSS